MPFSKLRRNTSNQTTRRANKLRKIGFENLTLGDDHTHKIASRIQNTRTARFETDFKTLIKKLGDREKIVPKDLTRETRLRVKDSLTFTVPTESTLPFSLSLKVMYSLVITGVRLENHRRSPVMCREQPESINQKPSMCPTCKIKNESESEKRTQHWG
jgi:hypothetical protein